MTTLRPDDVPGAVLSNQLPLENYSVLKLQRWLECRGLKKTGSKGELIIRIKNCIEAGNEDKIFIGIDGGKWYDAKRNIHQRPSTSSEPDIFDNISWGKFPSCDIPQYFNKGHIYTYIVGADVGDEDPETTLLAEDQSTTTVKPFRRGHQYVNSEHISLIEDGQQKNFYFCKCKCLSSFQKTLQYNVKVILNKTSGAVIKGICECKQSALGKCSHVTACLIFIWEYTQKYGYSKLSSTSIPRQWGIGSKKRNPSAIKAVDYPIKRFKPKNRGYFDPRPIGYEKEFDINCFVTDLQKVENVNSMFQSIFQLTYNNFEYSQNELEILQIQTSQFIANMASFMEKQNAEKTLFEVPGTYPQGSEGWLKCRSFFITSSNAKIVTTQLKSESAKKNFLLKNLWMVTKPVTTVAMAYGKKNEEVARRRFSQSLLKKNEVVTETGLMYNKKFPYFATSPDGVVMAGDSIEYLIEIKCPKILENCKSILDFDNYLSKTQLNNFFLTKKGNKIFIKETHPYLYQIIMSLIIFEKDLCMLIVWSPADMLAIPINENQYPQIVAAIIENATDFYLNMYVPELFAMRAIRDLPPVCLNMN